MRKVGIAVTPSDVNPFFVLRITEGEKVEHYTVHPKEGGRAFVVSKMPDGEHYNVVDGKCTCKGHVRWGHCRHVEGLKALQKAGRL